MRRGLGNPRRETATTFVQNRAQALKSRFATYRTMLQTEGPNKFFEPLPSVKRQQIRDYAAKQRLNAPPEKAQAWYTWETMQDKFVEGQDYEYQRKFMAWLMGKGLEEDHKLTPWGREAHALLLPEVRAWIEQMVDAASITENYLTKLLFRGPQTMEEYAIYYKYLLHMDEYLTTDDAWFFVEFPELYNGYHLQRGPDAILPGPPEKDVDSFELGKMGDEGRQRVKDIRENAGDILQKFREVKLAAEYRAASADARREKEEALAREIEELAADAMDIVDAGKDVQDAAVQAEIRATLAAKEAKMEARRMEQRVILAERKRLEEEERQKRREKQATKEQLRRDELEAQRERDKAIMEEMRNMYQALVQRTAPMEGVVSTNEKPVEPPPEPELRVRRRKPVPEAEPPELNLAALEKPVGAVPGAEEANPLIFDIERGTVNPEDKWVSPFANEYPNPFADEEESGPESVIVEPQLDPMEVVNEERISEGAIEPEGKVEFWEAERRLDFAKEKAEEMLGEGTSKLIGTDSDGSIPVMAGLSDAVTVLAINTNLDGEDYARKTFKAVAEELTDQLTKENRATEENLRDALTVYFRKYHKIARQAPFTFDSEAEALNWLGNARREAFNKFYKAPMLKRKAVVNVTGRLRKAEAEPTIQSGSDESQPFRKGKRLKQWGEMRAVFAASKSKSSSSDEVAKRKANLKAIVQGKQKATASSSDSSYVPSSTSTSSSSPSSSKAKSPKRK